MKKKVDSRRPSSSVLPNVGYIVGWRSDGIGVCSPLGVDVSGVDEGEKVNRRTRVGALLVGWDDSMIGMMGAEVGGKVNASVGAKVTLH